MTDSDGNSPVSRDGLRAELSDFKLELFRELRNELADKVGSAELASVKQALGKRLDDYEGRLEALEEEATGRKAVTVFKSGALSIALTLGGIGAGVGTAVLLNVFPD